MKRQHQKRQQTKNMIASPNMCLLMKQDIMALCLRERGWQINPRTQHAHHKCRVDIITQINIVVGTLLVGDCANQLTF